MNIRDGKTFEEAMLTGVLKPCLVKSIDPLTKKEEIVNQTVSDTVVEPSNQAMINESIVSDNPNSFIPNYTPAEAAPQANFEVPSMPAVNNVPLSEQIQNVGFVPNSAPIIEEKTVLPDTPVFDNPINDLNNNVIENQFTSTPAAVYEEPVITPIVDMAKPVTMDDIVPITPIVNEVVSQPNISTPVITPVEVDKEMDLEAISKWLKDANKIENYVNRLVQENSELKETIKQQNDALHNVSTDFTNSVGQNQRLM